MEQNALNHKTLIALWKITKTALNSLEIEKQNCTFYIIEHKKNRWRFQLSEQKSTVNITLRFIATH